MGIANAGQVLTGEYAYSDLDGDLEGISTFRWLSDGVTIGGASSITYTIASGDVGHAITFEVTPVAVTGVLQGAPVQSSPQTILNVPITQILSGPASISSQTAAVFTFQGFEPGLTFSCQLDGGTASLCSSGVSYTVTDGNHTFAVNAVNASGIAGPAATYTWVVDTTPPPDPVVVGPQTPGDLTNVTFNFTDTENNVFFWCSANGAPFTICVSPLNINTPQLSTQQTFQVYAGDSVGNLGPHRHIQLDRLSLASSGPYTCHLSAQSARAYFVYESVLRHRHESTATLSHGQIRCRTLLLTRARWTLSRLRAAVRSISVYPRISRTRSPCKRQISSGIPASSRHSNGT